MQILARAQELQARGRDVIHLEVGEPDFPTPEPIVKAGQQALAAGRTRYTPALGLPPLRQAIADYYAQRYGVRVDAGRIAVTPGASGALLLALAALLDAGDELLLADPGYPCNRHFARLLEVAAVGVPVEAASRYQLSAALVERHWGPRTRGVLVANPGNPTGTVIPAAELRAIREVVRARGGWLIVDEIYHELIYDRDEPSAVGLGEDVLVVNSFSKYWCMSGWRLGWLVAPSWLMPAVERLAQNVFLAAPTPAQYAALAAFDVGTRSILNGYKEELKARRDFLLPALRALGFEIATVPDGAFYVWAGLGDLAADGEELARRLLEEAGVALTPGRDFGRNDTGRYVRFAYTTDRARLDEACARIAAWSERARAAP
ncbi:MAG: aminotransferase class I/II-fold pyridoxal phosphate-dependent enzyme [Burkholderiales bacterium]|nr:aminotransferase class I/II-fold pyridoxal phosphate-dependent enzyme [Burkholderiales bacterium]